MITPAPHAFVLRSGPPDVVFVFVGVGVSMGAGVGVSVSASVPVSVSFFFSRPTMLACRTVCLLLALQTMLYLLTRCGCWEGLS